MNDDDEEETIILRAYAECSLAAKEKGLTGERAVLAVLNSAAKVATRILGRDYTRDDVERIVRNR